MPARSVKDAGSAGLTSAVNWDAIEALHRPDTLRPAGSARLLAPALAACLVVYTGFGPPWPPALQDPRPVIEAGLALFAIYRAVKGLRAGWGGTKIKIRDPAS